MTVLWIALAVLALGLPGALIVVGATRTRRRAELAGDAFSSSDLTKRAYVGNEAGTFDRLRVGADFLAYDEAADVWRWCRAEPTPPRVRRFHG